MFVGNEMYPILYTGQKSYKKVYEDESEGKSFLTVPFCGLDGESESAQLGVGLLLFDPCTEEGESACFWGMFHPRDLVASYRGMKILELLPEIRFGTLCAAWYAGARKVHSSDQNKVDQIIDQIGKDAHAALLLEPLPTFQQALMVLTNHGIKLATHAFVDEIRAGTMKLTPFLEELGVDHPSVTDAQQEHAQRLVRPYLPRVRRYLQSRGHALQGFLAENIEHYVLEGIIRGIKEEDLMIGTAIIAGHYETSLMMMSLMGFFPDSDKFLQDLREKELREVAGYLAQTYGADEPRLKKGLRKISGFVKAKSSSSQPTRRTAEDYVRLLTDIRDRWSDMPQVVEL